MKKLMMAVMAASVALPVMAVPGIASAQSAHEIRHDNREIRHDRQELRHDIRHGHDRAEIRHDRRELRHDRQERREDWRDYRRSHRNVFHRGAYSAPRGYQYRRIGVGHRFAPAFYGQRYWISDYGRYRLPAPRAHSRWIRYGNDAVLINARNGVAIQVLNGFFW